MELGPTEEAEEAISEVENVSDVSDGEPASTNTPAAAGTEQPQAGSAPLSAQVREQGGRYMHRLPRRMRRKMRGGGQGEGERRSQQPLGATQVPNRAAKAAAAENVAARSEQRPSSPSIPVPRELHCPPSPSFSRKARRSSSKSPRSRWDKKARALLRISLCRDATWSTCRRSNTPAFRARSRATKSACA